MKRNPVEYLLVAASRQGEYLLEAVRNRVQHLPEAGYKRVAGEERSPARQLVAEDKHSLVRWLLAEEERCPESNRVAQLVDSFAGPPEVEWGSSW